MAGNSISSAEYQSVSTSDGAEISYRDTGGDGTPFVFIPGWACIQEMWDAVAAEMPEGARVVTLDYAGFGRSSAVDRAWTMENLAGDVAAVIEGLDLTGVVLVGHSMGGGVALEAAKIAPSRVAKVIGADTFTYAAFYPAMEDELITATIAAMRPDFDGSVRGMMAVYFLEGSDPAQKDYVSDTMAGADPDIGLAVMADFLRWDVNASVSACPVPVGSINSADLLDQTGFDALKDDIEITLIEGVGHFLMMEKPGEFCERLKALA